MKRSRLAPRPVGWDLVALALVMLAGIALLALGVPRAHSPAFLAGLALTAAGAAPGALRVIGSGRH